jgi:putative aldouronate transport system permease protein
MSVKISAKKPGRIARFMRARRIGRNWDLYLLLIPFVVYYLLFHYQPMYGIQLAFKNFKPVFGIAGSPWLDPLFRNFTRFFNSPFFSRLLRNTLNISALQLFFGFPLPILLALMLNEVGNLRYKKIVQNVTYAPYFLSTVVVVGMIRSFTTENGIINVLIRATGGSTVLFMMQASWFLPLYIGSYVWQAAGWNSIIYIAALSGVDPQLIESAQIDGANRLQRIWHINIPGILPTIVILLILNVGQIMNVGFEKAFLMQNDINLPVSDIISVYSYKIGIQGAQYPYATAIGLFNAVVNSILLISVNAIARRVGDTSLW